MVMAFFSPLRLKNKCPPPRVNHALPRPPLKGVLTSSGTTSSQSCTSEMFNPKRKDKPKDGTPWANGWNRKGTVRTSSSLSRSSCSRRQRTFNELHRARATLPGAKELRRSPSHSKSLNTRKSNRAHVHEETENIKVRASQVNDESCGDRAWAGSPGLTGLPHLCLRHREGLPAFCLPSESL